jgi:putative Holliday junction resolvase
LGLDVGKKTIGLALSNPAQTIATPLDTIKRTKFTRDMEALKAVIEEYEVGGFVLGYPVNMDSTEGPRTQSIRDFAIEMDKSLLSSSSCGLTAGSQKARQDAAIKLQHDGVGPWIALWDERLSTVSVEEFVDKNIDKRKTKTNAKTSGLIDKLAAQVILQGALDFLAQIT